MADLPFPWCIYEANQSIAARCGRLSDRSWGIENGLNKILTAVESGTVPENQSEFQRGIDRAVATGSWVERNHARLRRNYLRPTTHEHTEQYIAACMRLTEIRERVSAAEWGLLMAVAAGVGYQEMANMTAGSARTRVARLRARLRPAAGKERP